MLKLSKEIVNTRYMKTQRAQNSAQIFALIIEEVKNLHHGVIKTLFFIVHCARVWINFTPEFANQ